MTATKWFWFCLCVLFLSLLFSGGTRCSARSAAHKPQSASIAGDTNRVYFVDPEGDDGQDGLSPQTAWSTLGKVNRMSFSPGDTVKLKCGGIWHESLNVPSSGAKGKPVTFSSYGAGSLPVLDASVSLPRTIGLDPRRDWVPTGSHGEYFTQCPFWTNQVFRDNLRASEGSKETLRENEFRYSGGNIVYMPPKEGNLSGAGIAAAKLKCGIICRDRRNVVIENIETRYSHGNSAQVVIADSEEVEIRNCRIHGSKGFGIGLESAHEVTVRGCEVYDVGLTGIGTTGAGRPSCNVTVSGNTIHHVGWLAMDRFNDGHGIGVGNLPGCRYWSIKSNDIFECGRGGGESYADGGCGPAVTVWETSNITVSHNRIHDNYRGGITLELGGQSPARDHEVSFNLIYNNGRNKAGLLPWGVGWSGIGVYKFQSDFEVNGVRISNNVIADNYVGFQGASSSALYLTVAGDKEMTGVEIRNNIVSNNGTTNYEYWKRNSKVRAILENNLFFRADSRDYVKHDHKTYDHRVAETFRMDTGCSQCLLENPLFVDPEKRDYRLASRSRFRANENGTTIERVPPPDPADEKTARSKPSMVISNKP